MGHSNGPLPWADLASSVYPRLRPVASITNKDTSIVRMSGSGEDLDERIHRLKAALVAVTREAGKDLAV